MAKRLESGVEIKKGAWTEEEDNLLRKCINQYGEGQWHRVPLRSGLNRCRQSCRLRWLNYLKPNLKKGHFTIDEVDLIQRLHKLLGNRWSLIAGRLPGRTANDVKNFWNTHISKKLAPPKQSCRLPKDITHSNIIRPRPHTLTFSNSLLPPRTNKPQSDEDENKASPSLSLEEPDECGEDMIHWWSSLRETDINCSPYRNLLQEL